METDIIKKKRFAISEIIENIGEQELVEYINYDCFDDNDKISEMDLKSIHETLGVDYYDIAEALWDEDIDTSYDWVTHAGGGWHCYNNASEYILKYNGIEVFVNELEDDEETAKRFVELLDDDNKEFLIAHFCTALGITEFAYNDAILVQIICWPWSMFTPFYKDKPTETKEEPRKEIEF